MLDNYDTDKLDLDGYYPVCGLESISEDTSDGECKARSRFRSRESGHGIQAGGMAPSINLANDQG